MTPLRSKMIRELEVQRKRPNTINSYVTAVVDLARYYRRSPEKISRDEVRAISTTFSPIGRLQTAPATSRLRRLASFTGRSSADQVFG